MFFRKVALLYIALYGIANAQTQIANGQSNDLLTWSDVLKLLVGFILSLVLIWAKSEGERICRLKTLKRSAWNVAKHHTDFREMLEDLRATTTCAMDGKVWISAVDLCDHYSSIVSELSKLDPKSSDIYINYLSAEEVIRKGYEHLATLRTELVKARTETPAPASEAKSIRSAISAQCLAIKKDLRVMAQRELELLKLIEIRKSDTVNPIKQLESTIAALDSELKSPA